MAVRNMLLRTRTGLEAASDEVRCHTLAPYFQPPAASTIEISTLRMRPVNDFGGSATLQGQSHVVTATDAEEKPAVSRDATDTLLAAFKQLKMEKEMRC